ncbi:BA75_04664T0 [Komagataella pastoris]|uniref:BA75_04664T0 n=1 Tax=Komagataella pastoris TaxID=4922 RepID=A0A1B2JJ75_PICPA|nr:BA75_04664T0 [Komagataella pastoris]
MLGIFSWGGTGSSQEQKHIRSAIHNVPNYLEGENEDPIDLQVKSLTYVFKRLKTDQWGPFLQADESSGYGCSLKVDNTLSNGSYGNDKLDVIYNIKKFEEKLFTDEHRILIDFPKNKMRSLLILSDDTDSSIIPSLGKENFQFHVLKANSSDEAYYSVLIEKSNIYEEHQVSYRTKSSILASAIRYLDEIKPRDEFTKDDRAWIIRQYVNKLAIHVQTQRIYRESLKRQPSPSKSRPVSRPTSPTKDRVLPAPAAQCRVPEPKSLPRDQTQSPQKERPPSPQKQRPLSPQKDRPFPTFKDIPKSPTKENAQLVTPSSPLSKTSSVRLSVANSDISNTSQEDDIYEQSVLAIRSRLEKEKKIIKSFKIANQN